MSALGRALQYVSSSSASASASAVPAHRARWEERRDRRAQSRDQLRSDGNIKLQASELPMRTDRSYMSTVRSTGPWSRSGVVEPLGTPASSSGRRRSEGASRTPTRPLTGESTEQSQRRQRRSPEVRRPSTAAAQHGDRLVQHEASVALEASRALQGTERDRLERDHAERQRTALRREVRDAIAREGVYRDPHIDAGTVVRVGMAGGPAADNRPVVDRHGRFFGMGAQGRARQVAHAQEIMAGGPLTPESNRRVLPLAVPVTPQMYGAPHSGGSPMLLHTHLNPTQGGFARRPSAELRALDALYDGSGKQFHHLGGARDRRGVRNPDYKTGAGYVVHDAPRGYITGPLTEVELGPTVAERDGVAPSAAVASKTGGLAVREYTAAQPAVRRIGGGSDPNWERRRPALHKLHPDGEELLKLQDGWNEGWGDRAPGRDAGGWSPPLVEGLHEAHGRLHGNYELPPSHRGGGEARPFEGRPAQQTVVPVFRESAQPMLYDGECRRSLSLREALES